MKRVLVYAFIIGLCVTSGAEAQSLGNLSLPCLGTECGDLTIKAYTQVGVPARGLQHQLTHCISTREQNE